MPSGVVSALKRTEHPAVRDALLHARGLAHWVSNGHAVRRRALRRAQAAPGPVRVQIGSGPQRLAGWLNSDLIAGELHLDLGRRLALPDRSVDFVFGEHVIEHLPERRAERLLGELHRVLRPGGVLRLTTPDLRKLLALYEDRNPEISLRDYAHYLDEQTAKPHERPCQVLNDFMRLWGHRWIYDEEDLRARLHEAGFAAVERAEPGHSRHEQLRGLERHGGAEWVNRAEAMCLEAQRGTV